MGGDLVLSARPGLRSAARRLTIHISPVALSPSLKYEYIWHIAIRMQSPEARPKKEVACSGFRLSCLVPYKRALILNNIAVVSVALVAFVRGLNNPLLLMFLRG